MIEFIKLFSHAKFVGRLSLFLYFIIINWMMKGLFNKLLKETFSVFLFVVVAGFAAILKDCTKK